jgi:hypothetical protein
VRIAFSDQQWGPTFKRALGRQGARVTRAIEGTARDMAADIKEKGDADIRAAGNFGEAWTSRFFVRLTVRGNDHVITVGGSERFGLFERGGTIRGQPLLWVPVSSSGARNARVRDYPGELVRVERPGKVPLLVSRDDHQAKFFGTSQITIPQKFHIRDVVRDVTRRLKEIYRRNFRNG